ncbi:MAG: gliding motility-associated C-terminal domain-containing protein [Flavobacteriales bacterium]|nr:gliding motility-associated C-terminal domain-containing protein [Flavobacteriales bacterium]
MRNLLITLCVFCLAIAATAQNSHINWSGSLTSNRTFVENKGQFDGFGGKLSSEVLFALDGGNSMILFTEQGLTFRSVQKVKNEYRKRGERTKHRYNEQREFIQMKWVGANQNSKLVAVDMASYKHTYALLQHNRSTIDLGDVNGYRKLIYKNVYPNIDVEYTIHQQEGIKYNVILHSGADPSLIKMQYAGGGELKMDAKGNIIVPSIFGQVTDHAPSTFYTNSNKPITSRFKLDGNVVSFELDAYDNSQSVTIDPWVTSPAFPNSGGIWDIDVDDLGNVYIYGGDTPMKLQKYNAAGALQWTYTTPWDSANYWIGTMVTEPTTGDCFITAGTDPRISRISTAGSLMWTASGGAFDEYWKLAFNCDYTKLMLGGTRLSLGGTAVQGYGYVFEIDMNNGAQLNSQEVASVSPGPIALISNPNEVRAMCSAPNGKYYYLTLDTIGVFDENLTLGYQDNSGYAFSYQVAGYGATNQSINAMAATTDYLYTQNGSRIEKRNIVGGAVILSATIPGGITTADPLAGNSAQNGGLVLDSCGNIYAGSGTGVYKFDENLNQLGFQSTPNRVYDVAVNPQGEVVACGQGFVASVNLGSCVPPKAVCLNCLELQPAGPYCHDGIQDTLVADPAGGTWSGPGIIDPILGIFDPAVADSGTHVIHFTPTVPLVCGIDSILIRVNYCLNLQACVDSLGYITIPNGVQPYTWSQTLDTLDCSACFPALPPFIAGCSTPPGCAVPTTYVAEFSNDSAVQPTGNWPLFIEDSQGNILQINSLSQLPACQSGCFIVANLPDTVVACTGENATATVLVTGAIGNIDYLWSTIPAQTTATATNLAPGSYYYVTVTDDSSCVAMDSVYVVEAECVGPIVCATPFGDMQADGFGPFTWYEFTSTTDCSGCIEIPGFPPCTFPPGCVVNVQGYEQFAIGDMVTPTGNWPVIVVDSQGDSLTINSFSELAACTQACYLTVDVPALETVCFGETNGQATAIVSGAFGAVSYSWNTIPVQTTVTATNLAVGTYVITATDANSCEATDTVEVVMVPEILLSVTATDSVCLGQNVGTATVTSNGGTGGFSYSWNTNPVQSNATAINLGPGTYTVTVTDLVGCTEQITATIAAKSPITVEFNATEDICVGSTDGTATAFVANSTVNYQFSWNTTPVQNGATASGLSAGTYTVTATDPQGCLGVASVTIGALPAVNADAGDDVTICAGQSVTLLATGGVIYEWENDVNTAMREVSPSATTNYEVSVTDNNGCIGSDTVTVFVVPVPIVSIEELDSVICDVEPPFMIVGIPPGGTFSGNGVSSQGLFEPLVAGDGVHSITYTYLSPENCEVDTTVSFRVDEHLCDVIAPNIFNPNSDFEGQVDFCGNAPQNNAFNLPCLEWYPGNKILIFDRWGRKCYEQENYHLKPWDGGSSSDGVYYYVLDIPNEEPIKGFFHLVR